MCYHDQPTIEVEMKVAATPEEVWPVVTDITLPVDLPGELYEAEWLADARAADEDSLLQLAEHLPAEAAEALLELATGGRPKPIGPKPSLPTRLTGRAWWKRVPMCGQPRPVCWPRKPRWTATGAA